jgi:F-box domain
MRVAYSSVTARFLPLPLPEMAEAKRGNCQGKHHVATTIKKTFNITTMSAIPVDVLREILEHVRKADLATLCRVNKIFCSCSQDVLYSQIDSKIAGVIHTLAQSTDLARRVRSFHTCGDYPELATALRNMSSLRRLGYGGFSDDASILDGCTFELDSFETTFPYSESLHKFLSGQSSLTKFTIYCRTPTPIR